MDYVIGLGSNLGSRRANLAAAVERVGSLGQVAGVSALYASEPWGPPQPDYLNAALRLSSALAPEALLARLLAIESELGRRRDPALRYGPRSLDLDILWASQPRAGGALTIPHPRLRERWFALAPLLDVAPELAPVYAPALAACGGRREPRARALAVAPCAEIAHAPGELRVSARAPELEDALADALSALGRAWFGELTAAAPGVALIQVSGPGVEAAARACIEQALAHVRQGFGFQRAAVMRLSGEGCECRLLGVAVAPLSRPLALRGFATRAQPGEARIELAVDDR